MLAYFIFQFVLQLHEVYLLEVLKILQNLDLSVLKKHKISRKDTEYEYLQYRKISLILLYLVLLKYPLFLDIPYIHNKFLKF